MPEEDEIEAVIRAKAKKQAEADFNKAKQFLERSRKWNEEKLARREAARKQQDEAVFSQCTFKPAISSSRSRSRSVRAEGRAVWNRTQSRSPSNNKENDNFMVPCDRLNV